MQFYRLNFIKNFLIKNQNDKSFITNMVSLLVVVLGYVLPFQQELIKSIGFFALSGAITNWLAIYMLFEEVPYLYGSGVIPNRFEEFKLSIKQLMMQQFFTAANIEQFIETEEQKGGQILNLQPLLDALDYEKIFQSLVSSIMTSSFGAMLLMMGGEEALTPLKEPFIEKIKLTLTEMVGSDRFKSALKQGLNAHQIGGDVVNKIEAVIDKRLNELTPQLVKEIVQNIIREHLGWLVVWGGIFGGAMGFLFYFA
jgi:uncharacterized membrane protein YheB (UPF0754 family)